MRAVLIVLTLMVAVHPADAFDTWWHAVETQKAADATGFSSDARLVLQVENYLTDMIAGVTSKVEPYQAMLGQLYSARLFDEGYDYLHFDALWNVAQVSANWDQLEKNTLTALSKYSKLQGASDSFRKIAELTALAASMHAVQDFYSHSNWVNYWMDHGGTVPLWFDVDRNERLKLPIHSGAYPDGSSPGHDNHADLNKDSSMRKLNVEAVAAATRASEAWIRKLMADDPSLPWAEMQQYTIQGDPILKDFLMRLDSTFLTSSSIVLHHFDGAHTAKFVFANNDEAKESNQAKIALALTIKDYLVYVAAAKNTAQLPSPYWSSHFIYHVPRDIANGLMVAGKTYVMP